MSDYDFPEELVDTSDDEWGRRREDRMQVGITDFAQRQLGDIVFVELPAVGTRVEQGVRFGVIESVKAVSDLYAPVTGKVLEVNETLLDRPELVNEECYGEGWLVLLGIESPDELETLLDAAAYGQHVESREG